MAGRPLSFLQLTFLILHLLPVSSSNSRAVDKTVIKNVRGREITEAVIKRISNSGIFPDDHEFLLRLAQVESNFGEHSTKFLQIHCGGIWKVDLKKFQMTQEEKADSKLVLDELHEKIKNSFEIDWKTVEWCDLRKPLYSGLAVSIYLTICSASEFEGEPKSPPITIRRQAHYWERYYRPENDGDSSLFIEQSSNIYARWSKCNPSLDLVVAVDASASFMRPALNFQELIITHIYSLLEQTFDPSFSNTRIGMYLFNNKPYHIASVDNKYSIEKLIALASEALPYFPGGDTRLDLALTYGAYMLTNATARDKGVPQLLLVFTDGQSSASNLSEALDLISRNHISTIVIGIGNETRLEELEEIAGGVRENVYQVSRLDTLPDLFLVLRSVLCSMPQKPLHIGEKYVDSLNVSERRHFTLVIEKMIGITVVVKVRNGSVNAYWAYTDQRPYADVHDGEIDGDTKSYIPAKIVGKAITTGESHEHGYDATGSEDESGLQQRVYLTVEGKNCTNIYEVYILEGDQDNSDGGNGAGRRGWDGYDKTILMIYGFGFVILFQGIRLTS